MAEFSPREVAFLTSERVLGRVVTLETDGSPHVVPVGWRYDPATGTIEVTGRNFARTKKYRNAKRDPRVALIIDDVRPPWRPRAVMVQGEAESVDASLDGEALIRITPRKIVSWGLG